MSFLVLTISISHFGVSGQYIQYNANAQEAKSTANRQIETATTEYEYYDDIIEDVSTTQGSIVPTTTTTTRTTTSTSTTTPKPITSYRVLTTHRNGFRPLNFKKKFEVTTKQQYQPDSYTEASNESAFVQPQQQKQQLQTPPPHIRNAIADINRRTTGKDYAQEKSLATSIESNNGNGNGNYFSRRYARFLFKLRSG